MPLMDPTVETVLKPPLLFLHGQAFTSAVWARTYSLQLAAQRGHRAVAIDLPGFGRSVAGSERIDPFVFLATAIHELHLGRPILVAPRHMPIGSLPRSSDFSSSASCVCLSLSLTHSLTLTLTLSCGERPKAERCACIMTSIAYTASFYCTIRTVHLHAASPASTRCRICCASRSSPRNACAASSRLRP